MRLRSLAKALLWFTSAPLARWKYVGVRAVSQAASGMHRSSGLSGSGRFDFAPSVVLGRRTRVHAEGIGRLKLALGVWIGDDCELSTQETISIGAHASLQNCSTVLGQVTLGAGCVCAPNLYISSAWHHFEDDAPLPIRWQDAQVYIGATVSARSRAVQIGEDCWIGINVVIAPGVTIGRGCVIGANSVVTRDLPPYSVAAGAPASVIRQRLSFTPPRALHASRPEHLPYFYCGFDMWTSGATTLDAALHHGGWPAGVEFTLALQTGAGTTISLTVHSAVPGALRHGSSTTDVVPGISRVRFPAQPNVGGLLAFAWSSEAGPGIARIAVISVEQDSE
jgi:acetyltransferase-like isoleucine patch superfamily enzyme